MLGVCNGAQILLEAGLVPGTGPVRRPTAAFTRNGPVPHFVCKHVVYETCDRSGALRDHGGACERTRSFRHGPRTAKAALRQRRSILQRSLEGGHLAFVYAHARRHGRRTAAMPNASALGCAGLMNRDGQRAGDHAASRTRRLELQSSRPARRHATSSRPRAARYFFTQFRRRRCERDDDAHRRDPLKIPDNEAYTALTALQRLGIDVARVERAEICGASTTTASTDGFRAARRAQRDAVQSEQTRTALLESRARARAKHGSRS